MPLLNVPKPGFCRNGIQKSMTAAEVTIVAVPMLIPRRSPSPW